jgi:hypothetical protein
MKHSTLARIMVAPLMLSLFFTLHFSCGGKPSEEGGKNPGGGTGGTGIPTPFVTSTPIPTLTPTGGSVFGSGFWIASSTQMFISRYDSNGNLVQPVIDLKGKAGTDGGITAIHSLDQNTLLAMVDPSVAGKSETIYSVDLRNISNTAKGNGVSTWLTDPSNSLYLKTIRSFVTGIISNTVIVPTNDNVFNVLYSSRDDNRELFSTPTITPSGVAGCEYSEISNTSVITNSGQKSLLILSSGSIRTLNVLKNVNGAWSCSSAYTYGGDSETTTAHVPVNSVQTTDGKVFVLYAHATASKIVRYTFDGTSLSAPATVFADQSLLGTAPLGLAVRSNDKVLFGNRNRNRVFEVNVTKGAFEGFYINNSYVTDVSAIISN